MAAVRVGFVGLGVMGGTDGVKRAQPLDSRYAPIAFGPTARLNCLGLNRTGDLRPKCGLKAPASSSQCSLILPMWRASFSVITASRSSSRPGKRSLI